MVKVKSGGTEFYLDQNLKDNLEEVKRVVSKKDWDYVAVVTGLPGAGKSTFSQNSARFLCPWFDESYIAFSAEEFIRITNEAKPGSAIVLDESFQSLNTKIAMSSDFLRIINHLQIIRSKNLYLFLCLPNFFDLAKGIAIFRAQHLFVCYSKNYGERGRFAAYNRDAKKKLYVDGRKYMNYNAAKPNFRGKFVKSKVVNWKNYEKMKLQHQEEQNNIIMVGRSEVRDKLILHLKKELNYSVEKIGEITGFTSRAIYYILDKYKEEL